MDITISLERYSRLLAAAQFLAKPRCDNEDCTVCIRIDYLQENEDAVHYYREVLAREFSTV